LILTVGVALHQLLDPSQYQLIPFYAGAVIAITVFGWGLGGLLGGVLADYLGRKRSMTLTILAYSLLTGLSAFAWDWLSFAVLRFLVGLVIGNSGPGAWRYMYLIGVLPALIVFWIRRNIPESPRWEESNRRRRAAYNLQRQGA